MTDLNGYSGIYNYHIKKCGGTSFNAWLSKTLELNSIKHIEIKDNQIDTLPKKVADRKTNFLVYGHQAIHNLLPNNTLRIVVIRNPIERMLSQIRDWRRESAINANHATLNIYSNAIDDSKKPLKEFLLKYKESKIKFLINNHQVRQLYIKNSFCDTDEFKNSIITENVLNECISNLHEQYDLVGISEGYQTLMNKVSDKLNLSMNQEIFHHNKSPEFTVHEKQEIVECFDLIYPLIRDDLILYKEAIKLAN